MMINKDSSPEDSRCGGNAAKLVRCAGPTFRTNHEANIVKSTMTMLSSVSDSLLRPRECKTVMFIVDQFMLQPSQ